MATQVGEYLVSTVGKYVHPRQSNASEESDYEFIRKNPNGEEIGCGRFYETMVFRAGKPCMAKGCGCGLPSISGSELESDGYNDMKSATEGHRALCNKVASAEWQNGESR